MAHGRDSFKKNRRLLNHFTKIAGFLPWNCRVWLFKAVRNWNGYKGIATRYILIKSLCKKCGDNVAIQPGVYIFHFENLYIGDNVMIHPMCYINAYSKIQIGNNVSISHNVSILSFNHSWGNSSIPIKYNPIIPGPIFIENDIWIGAGVRILAGVTISSRSIVAAGCIVTKNVDSHTIVGGVPNRVIKIMEADNENPGNNKEQLECSK